MAIHHDQDAVLVVKNKLFSLGLPFFVRLANTSVRAHFFPPKESFRQFFVTQEDPRETNRV